MKLSIEKLENRVNARENWLNLNCSGISDDDIPLVCSFLKNNPSIKRLECTSNNIGSEGAKALAANKTLTSLDVAANNICVEGAKALAKNTRLITLNLAGNYVGDHVALALASSMSLTTLDISGNQIGDEGAKALAANPTLSMLDIGRNQIGDEGVKALAANTSLTSLSLSVNNFGVEGVKSLAMNSTLRSLDVRANNINTEGAQALATNTTLTTLNIFDNKIDAAGAKALAANSSLTSLDIGYNKIDDKGSIIFANALKNNFTLIHLGHNLRNQQVDDIIINVIVRNKAIQSYPQHTDLILTWYFKKSFYKKFLTISPLSLSTLCGLVIIKTKKQKNKQQQIKNLKVFEKSIPDEISVLLSNLQSLQKDLTIFQQIVALPHYGIDELSILPESKGKRLKI